MRPRWAAVADRGDRCETGGIPTAGRRSQPRVHVAFRGPQGLGTRWGCPVKRPGRERIRGRWCLVRRARATKQSQSARRGRLCAEPTRELRARENNGSRRASSRREQARNEMSCASGRGHPSDQASVDDVGAQSPQSDRHTRRATRRASERVRCRACPVECPAAAPVVRVVVVFVAAAAAAIATAANNI